MTIHEIISTLRRNAGFSQDELAEKLNVSRQSVSKWENGKATPDADKILALSELFGVSTDYLLKAGEEDNEPGPPAVIDFSEDDDPTQDIPVLFADEPFCQEADSSENQNSNRRKLPVKKIIFAAISLILIIALIIPIPTGLYEKWFCEEYITYPYVLVHGLGGYGADSKINDINPYWGSETGNLAAYLNEEKGYEVYEASVGPFSSTWDRACELYAQLTGTTVDYGEAHSKAHGHERYGRKYTQKAVPDWGNKTKGGQTVKINLIGHSFGGATVRMLTSLLEYGNEEEQKASPENVSELFKGGKGNLINSVTTLCAPHNGSTLYYCIEKYNLVDYALDALFLGSKLTQGNGISDYYDLHLEHFGISSDSRDTGSILKSEFGQGKDNAAYDLSPDGAAQINKSIKTVDNVYYFSYAYSATRDNGNNHKPDKDIIPVHNILYYPATLIGSYSENTVSDYNIDKSWLENDGMVNVISAKYPFTDEWQEYDGNNIVKGKWNVMPVQKGHHGTVIGMDNTAKQTRQFYLDLFSMIEEQPRDKKYYFKGLF